jgi:hypothetical protein
MSTPMLVLLACLTQAPAPAPEKLPIQILYAGNAGTPYSAAWEHFLEEHAARVKFVAGSALRREDLTGFDLLVVDGEVESRDAKGDVRLHDEKLKIDLDDLQGFPVVLMGGQGGFLSDDLKIKTSWHAG